MEVAIRETGRPMIDADIRNLIRRMSWENQLWGTPRIGSELRLLGYDVSKATVDKYRIRHRKPPSQTWRIFLDNHTRQCDSDLPNDPVTPSQLPFISPSVNAHWWGNFRLQSLMGLRSSGSISSWMSSRMASLE